LLAEPASINLYSVGRESGPGGQTMETEPRRETCAFQDASWCPSTAEESKLEPGYLPSCISTATTLLPLLHPLPTAFLPTSHTTAELPPCLSAATIPPSSKPHPPSIFPKNTHEHGSKSH
jgi:hypothetical protein